MTAEAVLISLIRVQLVASIAIVLVLALRPLVLRRLGAGPAYLLWLIVPLTAVCMLLPARERVLIQPIVQVVAAQESIDAGLPQLAAVSQLPTPITSTRTVSRQLLTDALLALWLSGAAALLTRSIRTTRRLACDPAVGPALVGVLKPKLVLPLDFETRFDARERALILAHEEMHRVSRHTIINALVELARCVGWFNPLLHLAAVRMRADQELACDAAVLATRPNEASVYAQALIKAQTAPTVLRMGCTWTSPSARRLHERIAQLAEVSQARWKKPVGAIAIAAMGVSLGYSAWAQQPARLVTQNIAVPAAVWTATADAPKGSLSTALEGDRHDRAIKLARLGNIDLVLFGTTNAEMFWWKDRGRPVWDQHFGSLRAVNFGSQGTQRDSLVWRMRNGELSGFAAKLVIVQTWLGAAAVTTQEKAVDTYAPIVAEIRKYQPQAKILLFADFPRGQLDRTAWRQVARENAAAFALLVDNSSVFYVDMGERFFLPDGTHDQRMWRFARLAGAPVGIQAPGFEAWAQELQPWIERFIR